MGKYYSGQRILNDFNGNAMIFLYLRATPDLGEEGTGEN